MKMIACFLGIMFLLTGAIFSADLDLVNAIVYDTGATGKEPYAYGL